MALMRNGRWLGPIDATPLCEDALGRLYECYGRAVMEGKEDEKARFHASLVLNNTFVDDWNKLEIGGPANPRPKPKRAKAKATAAPAVDGPASCV